MAVSLVLLVGSALLLRSFRTRLDINPGFGSAPAVRVLSGVLYGVNATDPMAFVVAPLVLLGVAIAAAWIPARRVTRISPVRAIRAE